MKPDLSQDIDILSKELGSFTPTASVIAEKYLGINNHDEVIRTIRVGKFPFRTFKARSSTHAPYLVHVRCVAEFLFNLDKDAI